MSNVFDRVGGLKPRRNVFDLSHRVNTTCDMGEIIPVGIYDCIAGDHFTIGNEVIVRFQALNAPVMHEIAVYVHYFFTPYRLLMSNWDKFISQGNLSDDDTPLDYTLPRVAQMAYEINALATPGSLWDYFGFQVGNYGTVANVSLGSDVPVSFPWQSYYLIWNEYYRDQELQDEVDVTQANPGNTVMYRNWRKDYFTASRPQQQRGIAPSLPIDISFDLGYNAQVYTTDGNNNAANPVYAQYDGSALPSITNPLQMSQLGGTPSPTPNPVVIPPNEIQDALGISATSFNISTLRLTVQLQKWLERNERAGTRYTEFLRAHYGVSPRDERLQRPEYIGGTKAPVVVSEVLQTSSMDSSSGSTAPSTLGQMGGHGLSANASYAGKYHVQEPGIIMALLSVMPKPTYSQGINRQWMRVLPIDYYFETFAHLSEQTILTSEVYYSANPKGDAVPFGYTGQYDELRVSQDIVTGDMRGYQNITTGQWTDNLNYWNLSREFSSPPVLNDNFIACVPDNRIFSVSEGINHLIINVHHSIKAVRPMPLIAEPGMLDHY